MGERNEYEELMGEVITALREQGYTKITNTNTWTKPGFVDVTLAPFFVQTRSEKTKPRRRCRQKMNCPDCKDEMTRADYSAGLRVGEPCRVKIKIFKGSEFKKEFGEWKYGTLLRSGRDWKVKLINGRIVTQDEVMDCPRECSKRDGENEFCVDVDGGRGQCPRCFGKGPKPDGFKVAYSCEGCGKYVLFLAPQSGSMIRRRLVGGPRARALMARLVAAMNGDNGDKFN